MTTRRLAGHDYRGEGSYFVTICTDRRKMLFVEPEVVGILEGIWAEVPKHFTNAKTDVFVVMPNHVHGVVHLDEPVVVWHAKPLQVGVSPGSLGAIVGSFKSAVTRELHIQGLADGPVWQRNYWDRVIRNEDELNRIRQYIAFNPIAWEFDHENPERNADDAL